MPTLKIDGKEIPFEDGDTVIRAAWRQGIEIPHYCWHPGLSIAANCRMCLVEITSGRRMDMPVLVWDEKKQEYVPDTKPKLQPACQMQAQDGMEVETQNEDVKKAQAAVQEFLLLNHPVDCPICDQAGECKLQDYWLDHQSKLKRKMTEPVHKVKGVRFGPTIVYDGERCIMCTRCIRVCDELVGDHVLDMRQRGNKNEIVLAPGRELDHGYTLMTEHVCPVGALTSRDFRFKARVWFLKSAPGVCVGCATGCNSHVDFDPRYDQVFRLRPRDNLDVNQYWMCDDGMMTYKRIHEDRVLVPTSGRGEAADELLYEEALSQAAGALGGVDGSEVAVVLSAQHASEDNYVLARFAKDVLGADTLYLAALGGWEADDILRHADNNPNRKGAEQAAAAVGLPLKPMEDLLAGVIGGEISAAVLLGFAAAEDGAKLASLAKLDTVVSLTTNDGPLPRAASLTIPVASWAEMHGTFVNAKGMAQTFKRAIPAPGRIEPAWKTLVQLASLAGKELPFAKIQDVRAAMAPKADTDTGAEEARALMDMLTLLVATTGKLVFVLAIIFTFAPVLIWAERRQSAMMQDRVGPVRAGIRVPERFNPMVKGLLGAGKMFHFLGVGAFAALAVVLAAMAGYNFATVGDGFTIPGGLGGSEVAPILSWNAILVLSIILVPVNLVMSRVLDWAHRSYDGNIALIGLLHPLADALKFMWKEDFVPPKADKLLHALAPILVVSTAIATFAVIPFADTLYLEFWSDVLPAAGAIPGEAVEMQVASVNVGILFIFAVAGTGVVGAAIAGYASDNKYSLLGGLRAAGQMVSYEVTLGLTIVPMFMIYGTLLLGDMVHWQQEHVWGVFAHPLAFVLFLTASIAETKRIPFDLPEGESEFVGGYLTEYSGMKFGMFFMGEFVEVIVLAALATTLFFGGYDVPFLTRSGFEAFGYVAEIPHVFVLALQMAAFVVKLAMLIWFQLQIRWTLPRFRYDQLMDMCWKLMLPVSLVSIMITGIAILLIG